MSVHHTLLERTSSHAGTDGNFDPDFMAEAAYVSSIVAAAMAEVAGATAPPTISLTPMPDGTVKCHYEVGEPTSAPAPKRPGALVQMPSRNAAPDLDAWEALMANMPRAAGAAERILGMASPSEHDMSLAHYMAVAAWSPQAIADALAWNRRRRGEDDKHASYYDKTVRKALEARR